MRRLLFAISCLVILWSCENKYVSSGRVLYKLYFDKVLKDPSSFKVYSEEYTIDGASVNWKLDYGAKNGFGAMDREQVEFSTSPNYIFINGEMYNKEDLR